MSRRFGRGVPQGPMARRADVREEIPRYLIVCEGEKTEPSYFAGFHAPSVVVIEIVGAGANTVSVVEEAIARRGRSRYDQVWCVFDRDSFPKERFNDALRRARNEGVRVAYSNEAFELWYLLHFEFCDSALSRETYKPRLSKYLGRPYRKNDPSMFKALADRQDTAIRNAVKLLACYDPPNPEADNPSTTVHVLVEELRRHERRWD